MEKQKPRQRSLQSRIRNGRLWPCTPRYFSDIPRRSKRVFIHPIANETQLAAAQAEMERLLEISNAGHERSADQDSRLEELAELVRSYEDGHWALPLPDPILAIKSRMDDLGLKLVDMMEEFGNKSSASLIMNRRRALTLPIIRRLSVRLSLPIAVLTQAYPLIMDTDVAPSKENLPVTG